jgi:iron complex outermembrane receptor protein
VTERYFAFGPAPGGFQVGNPSLDPEMKWEIDAGLTRKGDVWDGSVSLFAATVNDYIYQSQIDRLDVNGDGTPDVLKGFRNVDADLFGGEVAARWRPCTHVSIPVAVSYVEGKNTTDDRDLPEIPPLTARIAARYDRAAWWGELGATLAARQDQIDATFPEDETPSYQVVHLKGGAALGERVDVEVGIENLFDQAYHPHLAREALMPVGDLKAGDEIPEPGRFVYLSVTCRL